MTPAPPRGGRGDAGDGLFVLGAWAALTAAAVWFVWTYGPPFPRWDDFGVVPVLTGERPVTAAWLWSQHNEHRIPLPRLVMVGALRLSGGDFRGVMVASVALLAAAALAAAVAARRRRGSWRESDAFFPLVLLHLGHHVDLLWACEVQFVLSTALAVGFLVRVVAAADWPRPGATALAAVALGLLPLCGANGVALVPALAGWLAVAGVAQVRRGGAGDRRAGALNLAAAAAALGLVAAYFRGYHAAPHHAPRAGPAEALRTGLQFASLTLGPPAERLWPAPGYALAALVVSGAAVLVRSIVRTPAERPRAVGLLAFLAALGSLALGIGWGRAGASGLGGFEPRYVTLAAPLGCALYFVWDVPGAPGVLRRLVPLGLFAALLVLLWPNTRDGLAAGRDLADRAARLKQDVRSGMPPYLVVKRHAALLHPSQDELTSLLPRLRDARLGVFGVLRPDPPFRAVPLPVEPSDVRLARWDRGTAHVTGVDPQLTFTLPEPRYVAGIRLRYAHANPAGTPARFKLAWDRGGPGPVPPEQVYANWNLPTGPGRVTTVWVGDLVRGIRIQPDNQPCEFRVEALELLVPEG